MKTKEISTYEKQAQDFLEKTGVKMDVKFIKHDFHFTGDKEKRDIYQIELKRGSRSFSVMFGQSLNDSGFYYTKGRQKIEIDRKHLENKNLHTLIRSKDYSFLNNGKSDIIHFPKAPTAYDFLACLTKYDPGTFENFCSEFGYDTNSKKAEKTYQAVKEEYLNVCSLFNDEEMNELQEIQ